MEGSSGPITGGKQNSVVFLSRAFGGKEETWSVPGSPGIPTPPQLIFVPAATDAQLPTMLPAPIVANSATITQSPSTTYSKERIDEHHHRRHHRAHIRLDGAARPDRDAVSNGDAAAKGGSLQLVVDSKLVIIPKVAA